MLVLSLLSVGASAYAACSGSVISSGCTRCGFLYLKGRPWVKETIYYTDEYGNCKTSSITIHGDCGDC